MAFPIPRRGSRRKSGSERPGLVRARLLVDPLEDRNLLSLLAGQTFDLGPNPNALAVADFNGDGIADLVVTGNFGLETLLGNGDGTFQISAPTTLGRAPSSVAAADLNGDGIPDLVVGDSTDNNVRVLLGNGDGTFQAGPIYSTGSDPVRVLTVDLNGDGIPDVLTVNNRGNSVTVLLGNGDGSFQPVGAIAAGQVPTAAAVGDFNSDGIPDLAVIHPQAVTSSGLSILFGNGDGTFQAPVNMSGGTSPWDVAAGDFDGDGLTDLAVSNRTQTGGVTILHGNGDGTFAPPQTYAAGSLTSALVAGDFNNDGIPDLVVSNFESDTGNVLLGNGDGSFAAPVAYASGAVVGPIVTGDFNGDGNLDVALLQNGGHNPSLTILLGHGDGTFQDASRAAVGNNPTAVATGDFNGDGLADLAVANKISRTVSVLYGNGDGTFQTGPTYTVPGNPIEVVAADVNGDGTLDLVVAEDGGSTPGFLTLLYGNGDGTFEVGPSSALAVPPSSVVVADVNGDGWLDVVLSNVGTTPSFQDGSVSILLNQGDGTLGTPTTYLVGQHTNGVAVADVNGDGIPDLVAASDHATSSDLNATLTVLLGNGDGTFQTAFTAETGSGNRPVAVVVGDFNSDGIPDIATANNGYVIAHSNVSVLLGNGDGSFGDPAVYPVGDTPAALLAADLKGEGNLDLVTADFAGGTVSVLTGQGDGTFQPAVYYLSGNRPNGLAVADVNGDGFLDLAVANNGSQSVSVMLNAGTGPSPAAGGEDPGTGAAPGQATPPAAFSAERDSAVAVVDGFFERLADESGLANPGNRRPRQRPAPEAVHHLRSRFDESVLRVG